MKGKLTLREHQMIMLDMMISFDRYCNKNNLRYFLAYGTLIGAVRHKGFIPWDDDVDIVMPRSDYERLINNDKISDQYEIVSLNNSHGYWHPFTYCNIIDRNTIMIEKNIKRSTSKGIFLDIFPIDGLPKNSLKRVIHLKFLKLLEIILSNGLNVEPEINSVKNFLKFLLSKFATRLDLINLAELINNNAKKYSYEKCDELVIPMGFVDFPNKKDYENFILADFEGHKFRIPTGYDNILRRFYGDYMKLPPVSERQGHHGVEIYRR